MLDRAIVSMRRTRATAAAGSSRRTGRLAGTVSLNLNEISRSSLAIPTDFTGTIATR